MSIIRTIRNYSAIALVGAAGIVPMAAQQAPAAVDQANCTFTYGVAGDNADAMTTNVNALHLLPAEQGTSAGQNAGRRTCSACFTCEVTTCSETVG
ncbi:hypothetical protein Lfu02_79020 [Longispora fulva]|uniref:Uncharacterized protein n=1 Tax=Longispora fulva TaxID=619741 RepID=A0A8J7KPI9_9ACTN|nr:hypothetical protein [Longispora fulva]MBG6136347.1 hypothetical protein [Longispora fulva]GIG63530.1 hypothetical protein Lfu02_79020 [Longispora fulva]